eukprot:CAMPEP_0119060802 /NCGR_PEP_ID=MMETSP1178-20130426/4714_1 /TAXON_ID=33656 /ORGANISM="unid sp, Strain CCMP2000" /LENGTH=168 /DNA_ID=CAMNT_0007041939 /DNA_START=23 /DNA_END=530 /DNA_ORIENTATION=-
MADDLTWVPLVKNLMSCMPAGAGWASFLAVSALAIWCVPDLARHLGMLVALSVGIGLLWKMEKWAAARDREAVEAGVPTGGWGSPLRFQEERQVGGGGAQEVVVAAVAAEAAQALELRQKQMPPTAPSREKAAQGEMLIGGLADNTCGIVVGAWDEAGSFLIHAIQAY